MPNHTTSLLMFLFTRGLQAPHAVKVVICITDVFVDGKA